MPSDLARPPSPLARAELGSRVTAALAAYLDTQVALLDRIGPEVEPLARIARDFVLDGGKRLRPAFAYWGFRGAGGQDSDALIRAVSGLEMLQAGALVHDDVMDGSDTRRGAPSVHRQFSALHRLENWRGSAETFGESAAILLGNLCMIWAGSMLYSSGLPQQTLAGATPVFDEMRTELMAGQYLDVMQQAAADERVESAMTVARFKSAKYTVEKPLHLGAALAGEPATSDVRAAYTAFGLPIGEAFQMRDDVLGVFGDPAETGKPAGDDLREGKRTVLVAMTLRRATPAQAAAVRDRLGDATLDSEGVAELRTVIDGSGALAEVERLIADRTAQALAALELAPVVPEARDTLAALAVAATARRV